MMSPKYISRSDSNQQEIVDALRGVGASVYVTHRVGHGFPDLAVGYRGVNYLIEVKSSPKATLTDDELEFLRDWLGQVQVAHSVVEALEIIGAIEKAPAE